MDDVAGRLGQSLTVRRRLPEGGLLYVERQVPFLCLYRRPADSPDGGTERLITGEPAYLIGTLARRLQKPQAALVRRIGEAMRDVFGAFLLIEVWAGPEVLAASPDEPTSPPPLTVLRPAGDQHEQLVKVLVRALTRDKRGAPQWTVVVQERSKATGPPPLLNGPDTRGLNCAHIGLEVPPLYRAAGDQTLYPVVVRQVRRSLSLALRKTVYHFAKTRTTHKPTHFHTMGRHALVKAVWRADRQLADIGRQYDFLLALSPTNMERAWRRFRQSRFEEPPEFEYRPLTLDIGQAKRSLFSVPLERIEDPTLADLFFEKQLELDRQLTILADRGSRRVLFGSLQLYGGVDRELLTEAERLIELIPPGVREAGDSKRVTAQQFARRAEEELRALAQAGHDLEGTGVEIRPDLAAGLMVSKGVLLIGEQSTFPRSRVEALLQHEVGTHVLTYLNGRQQPLQQLHVGLADYDETQEGLAVLAEYLAGGLSRPRMRLLAGRVVAAHLLEHKATFVDTFRMLLRYGFSQSVAFAIAARTYRGGGLTKDAVYLRGLIGVLDYLRAEGPLEPLYVGKIGRHHVPIVRELQARRILGVNPVLPRFLQDPAAQGRLAKARGGCRPYDLTEVSR
jgi:uncharacterized protein (TIGR02421 family)